MRTIDLIDYFLKSQEEMRDQKISMEDFCNILLSLAQYFIEYCEYRSIEEKLADHFYDFANLVKEEIFLYWYKQGCDHLAQKPKIPDDFDLKLRELFQEEVEKLVEFVSCVRKEITEEDKGDLQSA